MTGDLYQQLRKWIAKHSAFFFPTTTGLEIKFLKKLFTEEDARMYLNLSDKLETPQQIAERAGEDPEKVAPILERMAQRGLVFPKRVGDIRYYTAAPFAHGILEHQLHRMDRELAELFEEYSWAEKVMETPFDPNADAKMPLRTVPINNPANVSRPIAPYEDVRELIMNQDRISVANCFCATSQRLLETGCNQPLEVCIHLGFYADYYIDLGLGRKITQEEALNILDKAEDAGLVHQIADCLDTGSICNCCPDCCMDLRVLKMIPNAADFVVSNHFSQVDADLCSGCETCIDRCPMDAISISEEAIASIALERCIGCGLCVKTCPTGAMTLVSKSDEDRHEPPFTSSFMRSSQDIESTIQ